MHLISLTIAAFSAVALHGCSKNDGTTTTAAPTAKPAGGSTTAAPTGSTTATPSGKGSTTSTKSGGATTTTTTTTAIPPKGSCLSTSCKAESLQGDYCMNVVDMGGKLTGHCFADRKISCQCDEPAPSDLPTPDPSKPAVSCQHAKCPAAYDYCQNSRPGFPGNCHLDISVDCSCSDADAGK
ncbi:hypothetical protein FOZ63_019734, partial [Perkinsus olseni]